MGRLVRKLMVLGLLVCGCRAERTEAMARADRQACRWKKGALAADTLATAAPKGKDIPIDHVVLVMQENHSFDSIFGKLTNGAAVAPDGVTNLDRDGATVKREHQTRLCGNDVDHSWNGSHTEFNSGRNDGFALANGDRAKLAMDYWDESDLPYYYALARSFALSDSHFCSVLGPTVPNRMFSLAGTAFGFHFNSLAPTEDADGNPFPNVFTELDRVGVSWKYYSDSSLPEAGAFTSTWLGNQDRFQPVSKFREDAAAGTLPAFAVVEPKTTDFGDNEDEHPPGDIQIGQHFTASVIKTLSESPNWARSALFFTYDEHGGFYDSVAPPSACAPDDLPALAKDGDAAGGFDRLGFRVPMVVVSPYAKRGYVSHHVTDHTSILRFVEARFDLPAMTARDANADPLFDLFDFSKANTTMPSLPEAVIDQDQLDYCLTTFPPD